MSLPEPLDLAARWQLDGERVAVASVLRTWGSSPRPVGSRMIVSSSGRIAGSVSGGCVEAAVAEAGADVLGGGPPRLLEFGIADETAWSVGLSCGGTIEVWVEQLPDLAEDPVWTAVADAVRGGRRATVLSRFGPDGPTTRALAVDGSWSILPDTLRHAAEQPEASPTPRASRCLTNREEDADGILLREDFAPPPRLVVVGAVHIAQALVRAAVPLDCCPIVVDPREALATAERFGDVELVHSEPGSAVEALALRPGEALVTLAHQARFDLAALRVGLGRPGVYLGALGSRKTHARRVESLAADGWSPEQIARIHAPIGLDLGGRRPEEIALAILAEWIAFRHGRSLGATPNASPGARGKAH